jgi:hypothetical protein
VTAAKSGIARSRNRPCWICDTSCEGKVSYILSRKLCREKANYLWAFNKCKGEEACPKRDITAQFGYTIISVTTKEKPSGIENGARSCRSFSIRASDRFSIHINGFSIWLRIHVTTFSALSASATATAVSPHLASPRSNRREQNCRLLYRQPGMPPPAAHGTAGC